MEQIATPEPRADANHIVTSMHPLVTELIEALGLPKHLIAFTLKCRAGEIMEIEAEYHPTVGQIDVDRIARATRRYAIVPVENLIGELPPKA